MTTKTRYVVTYRSEDPTKTRTISFGVKTKTKAQALTRTREYIYANEIHEDSEHDYKLIAEISLRPALYEIPDIDEVVNQSEQEIVYEDY